jgi:hypothetical protein
VAAVEEAQTVAERAERVVYYMHHLTLYLDHLFQSQLEAVEFIHGKEQTADLQVLTATRHKVAVAEELTEVLMQLNLADLAVELDTLWVVWLQDQQLNLHQELLQDMEIQAVTLVTQRELEAERDKELEVELQADKVFH